MKPKYFRIGRIIYRSAKRDVALLTCENEFVAAVRLREFIRCDGGNLGPLNFA